MKFVFSLITTLALCTTTTAQVTVVGQGTVTVTPDNATINVVVSTDNKNMRGAVTANAEETKKVVILLKEVYKINDIQTHTFSVHPSHQRDANGKITKNNFVANNHITITVKDISKAGDILGAIGTLDDKNNTLQITGIHFTVSSDLRNSVLNQARKSAFLDAHTRAKLYAETAGKKLGDVKTITEIGSRLDEDRTNFAMAESTTVPVFQGSSRIIVNINAIFNFQEK